MTLTSSIVKSSASEQVIMETLSDEDDDNLPPGILDICFSPMFQEIPDHFWMIMKTGHVETCNPILILMINTDPSLQHPDDFLQVTISSRSHKWGHPTNCTGPIKYNIARHTQYKTKLICNQSSWLIGNTIGPSVIIYQSWS